MIVPFLSYLIAQICGFNIDQALLTMFLTGCIELIILIWSAKNPNKLAIFGNAPQIETTETVLNHEYERDTQ